MNVTITSDQPINAVITSDTPNVLEVIDTQFINVVVSIVKDGQDGAQGQPGEPGTPAVNNTLEAVRAENKTIEGDIDANGNTIINLKNATENQQPITKAQADAYLLEAKTYAETISAETVRWAGFWDASIGTYPTGSGIRRGDQYEISVAGTIAGNDYEVGDLIRARINAPGQSVGNWSSSQGNVQQATESRQGSAKISTAANAADENTTNDVDVITSKKLWQNFWQRVLALSWTWNARQIFSIAPRLSSLTIGNYLKLNTTKDIIGVSQIPVIDIEPMFERYFVYDAVDRVAPPINGVASAPAFYLIPANTFRTYSSFTISSDIIKTVVGNNTNTFQLKHHTSADATGGTLLTFLNAASNARQVKLNVEIVLKPGNIGIVTVRTTSNTGTGSSTVLIGSISFNPTVDNYFFSPVVANNVVDIFTQILFTIKGIY